MEFPTEQDSDDGHGTTESMDSSSQQDSDGSGPDAPEHVDVPWHFDHFNSHPWFEHFFSQDDTHAAASAAAAAAVQGPDTPVTSLYASPTYLEYIIPGGQAYPNVLDSSRRNLHAVEFLMAWTAESLRSSTNRPTPSSLKRMLQRNISVVRYADLRGDQCDFQGIDWTAMGVSRKAARRRRSETFQSYVNIMRPADVLLSNADKLPTRGNFFRFRRTDALDDTRLAHFQLRNSLACPSRIQAFYPTKGGIQSINPLTGAISSAIKIPHGGASFSNLTSGYGVLMGGTLNGEYFIRSLDAEHGGDVIDGVISRDPQATVNHMEMFKSRESDSPRVAICGNDNYFRVMDIQTQSILSRWSCDRPFNCSALSKDTRLRAMVGDFNAVLICDAASGKALQSLKGHRDFGFACAWSDDGWTLASGNQDRTVCVWDARRWNDSKGNSTPVAKIWSEMASVRSLRFSPLGSGKPVLVAAEEADFINIIDAQTYNSKQTIDIFGLIGGVDFANEGRDLNVLCDDPSRGAFLQFERCGLEAESILESDGDMRPDSWLDPVPGF